MGLNNEYDKTFLDEASRCQLIVGSYEMPGVMMPPDCCTCAEPAECGLGFGSIQHPEVYRLRQHPALRKIRERRFKMWRNYVRSVPESDG